MSTDINIDLSLIACVLDSDMESLNLVRALGIKPDMMSDPKHALALDHLYRYALQYNALPERGIIEAKADVVLPTTVKNPIQFYLDEVLDRGLRRDLKVGGEEVAALLLENKPRDALDRMESLLRHTRQNHTFAYSQVDSIPRLFGEVVDYYDKIKSGEKGVLTPWPTVNEETLGFWPEDLAVFAARLGIGKTWCAALIAHGAWAAGHKVLFGTTEISKLRVAMRMAAIHFKLPYGLIRKGMLDAFQEKQFKEGVAEILQSEGFYVIGGDFDFRVESYEAAVISVDPALSVLDGAYLLKTEGKNRTERAANAFDELKRICKRTKVPNVVTMQFNREVKANSKGSADAGKIALTDVAGWNADLIYGLIQTEDMKKNHRMIFKPLKVREGEGKEFEVNWDIDANNYAELPKGDEDDEWSTGAAASVDDDVPF